MWAAVIARSPEDALSGDDVAIFGGRGESAAAVNKLAGLAENVRLSVARRCAGGCGRLFADVARA